MLSGTAAVLSRIERYRSGTAAVPQRYCSGTAAILCDTAAVPQRYRSRYGSGAAEVLQQYRSSTEYILSGAAVFLLNCWGTAGVQKGSLFQRLRGSAVRDPPKDLLEPSKSFGGSVARDPPTDFRLSE